MLRSPRILLLFFAVLASYGTTWSVARLLGPGRSDARWARTHRKNAARLALSFQRLGGVFIKMGQVLSVVGTFLPREYGEELEALQDHVKPRPFGEIERRLIEALGPGALDEFQEFERTPIAAASLAQVHAATTRSGERVAVKILYPGIEKLIRGDLRVLGFILPFLKRLAPVARLERVLGQLGAMLERETNYENEKRNIERIRDIFADTPDLVVPRVIEPLTNAGVLTLSYEEGIKVNAVDALATAGIDPVSVARLLVGAYFRMLFEHGVFHADPHPGNFLVRPGPKLVVLDYGAVEDVTLPLRQGMKMVIQGALKRDDDVILRGLERMGFVAEGGDRELLKQVGRDYLKTLGALSVTTLKDLDRATLLKLSGYQEVRGKLRAIMKSVEYPEGYFYVERTLALLFGLVGQLAPKLGLAGLVLPHAAKVFARAGTADEPASGTGPVSGT